MDYITQFIVAAIIFGILDGLWLTLVAKTFYQSQIGKLLLVKPNMGAAIIFYVIYLVGLLVFVIQPALHDHSMVTAAGLGAFFGFVAYSTYDLTNLATLKGFTRKLVIVDLIWGTAATMLTSVGTYLVLVQWLGK